MYNISGVAYGATLGAYKVIDCEGYTTDDRGFLVFHT
jgi:hypothetical protein